MKSNNPNRRLFIPITIFFVLITGLLAGASRRIQSWKIDTDAVIIGNLILFIVTALSLYLYKRAMTVTTTAGFLTNSYGGVMIKLFVCAITVAVYAFLAKENLNKGAIFTCIFLYFVYTIIEMRSLMQWNKDRKNA